MVNVESPEPTLRKIKGAGLVPATGARAPGVIHGFS
jgi:hypothetical protein